MGDPEKLKQLEEKIRADPKSRQQLEALMKDPAYIKQMQEVVESGVEKLRQDPEMKAFFDDVEQATKSGKNPVEIAQKYQKDERIMRKFADAMGGPDITRSSGIGDITHSFGIGDEVIIQDLQARPELNGKKAVVVSPTLEEQETLKGSDRLVVRLTDSGEQFAVRPGKLRTFQADEAVLPEPEASAVNGTVPASELSRGSAEATTLEALREDPELQPVLEDIDKNGVAALEKYWKDERVMSKLSKALGRI